MLSTQKIHDIASSKAAVLLSEQLELNLGTRVPLPFTMSSPEAISCLQVLIKPASELGLRWFVRLFAVMIWKLRLEDKAPKQILKFNYYYPYCFRKSQAISVLQELELEFVRSSENLRICTSISPEEASTLVQRFFEARLLHHPRERTCSVVKEGLELQPTPKGVAILREEISLQLLPAEALPPILRSCFNSMRLTMLERDFKGDILYLRSLLFILFIRMMGNEPHCWDADTVHTVGTSNEVHEEILVDNFGLEDPQSPTQKSYASELKQRYNHWANFSGPEITEYERHPVGPLDRFPGYHRYFLNPQSDAHVQYFVSGSGIRLLSSVDVVTKNKTITSVSNCLTGKAVLQWLSDCTDCLTDAHALGLANLILSTRLIEPVKGSRSQHDYFVGTSAALYRVSRLGLQVCHWQKENKREVSEVSEAKLPAHLNYLLFQIYSDAGLRILFKEHLKSELCVENYDFHFSCNIFQHLVVQLVEKERSKCTTLEISLLKEGCTAVMIYIFSGFLACKAPYALNITSDMREGICLVMMKFFRSSETLKDTIAQLVKINGLLKDAQIDIWRLMAADSISKFLESEALEETTKTIWIIDGRTEHTPFAVDM